MYAVAHIVEGKNFTTNWNDFEYEFYPEFDDMGAPTFVQVFPNKICRHIHESFIVNAVLRYSEKNAANESKSLLTPAEAAAVVKIWQSIADPFPHATIPVAEKSNPIHCWHRLDFDLEDGPTPTFDEMFSRLENGPALMAWIGSLFIGEADLQQYAWIYGEGNNGKGELARFLQKVLGPGYTAQQPPVNNDKFWLAGLIDKRLAVFADCSDSKFPTTGLFKSLTGGDAQKIEEKGKQPYTANLFVKCLFLSNERPQLRSSTADRRRAIYCEMEPIRGELIPSSVYGAKLMAEGAAFLYKCREKYRELCPYNNVIPTNTAKLDERIEENEQDYYDFMEKHFVQTHDEKIPTKQRKFVRPARVQELLNETRWNFADKRGFSDWMCRVFNVRRVKVRLDNNSPVFEWRYLGIKEKNASERDIERGATF